MRQHERARCSVPRGKHIDMLLRKAAQDEYVLDRLVAEDDAPVEVFGFHAQQAAEKLLKAVLVAAGAVYPRTHRLTELTDLLRTAGIQVPAKFDELRHLTPFAVEFRYEVTPEQDETPLNKRAVYRDLQDLKAWAGGTIAELLHADE